MKNTKSKCKGTVEPYCLVNQISVKHQFFVVDH